MEKDDSREVVYFFFGFGTGVLRHNAGGIHSSYVHTCMVPWMCIIHNKHARVMEAENSITLNYI